MRASEWRLQAVRYVLAGAGVAAVDLGATLLGYGLLGLNALQASLVGYSAGLACSFLSQSLFTFRLWPNPRSAIRFLVLVLINLAITAAVMRIAEAIVAPREQAIMAGKIVSITLVAMTGFVLGRFWVFAKP